MNIEERLKQVGLDRLTPDSSPEEICKSLKNLATSCQTLTRLDLLAVREAVIGKLRELGVSAPTQWAATALESHKTKDKSETEPIVKETVPWEESVDGASLLNEITSTFSRYLVLPSGAAEIMALWVLHTHSFDIFFHTPYLCINSPTKGCGKTTALDMLGQLSCKPLPTSNITAAAVFRTIDDCQPTLMIDEADTFLGFRDELRGVLNSGNRKNTAFTIRLEKVGDDFRPRRFSTWCPKAFALIGRLPGTLEDRSIVVTMHRKTDEDGVEEFAGDKLASTFEELQQKLARWTQDNLSDLRKTTPEMPNELINRERDKFRPLFAIAEAAGGNWPNRVHNAALGLSDRAGHEEKETAIQLLADIRELSQKYDWHGGVSSYKLANQLVQDMPLDRPWSTFDKGQEISQKQIANLLAPFGIRPAQLWINGGKVRGYRPADFEEAFRRYLPPPDHLVEAVEPNNDRHFSPSQEAVEGPLPTGSRNTGNSRQQRVLPDLPGTAGAVSNTPKVEDSNV